MSSARLAVALAALVALAGCSALLGLGGHSGNDATPNANPPDHHAVAFVSDTGGHAFEATITVSRDGETLAERTVRSDGNGSYVNVTTLSKPGPYTVTVNTTLPGSGGENMSERVRVDGDLGNETVIRLNYDDVQFETLTLPRRATNHPLYYTKSIRRTLPVTVVVNYHGERVVSKSLSGEKRRTIELADLPGTGVYRVAVKSRKHGTWANQTLVLSNPENKLLIRFPRPAGKPLVMVLPPDVSLTDQ